MLSINNIFIFSSLSTIMPLILPVYSSEPDNEEVVLYRLELLGESKNPRVISLYHWLVEEYQEGKKKKKGPRSYAFNFDCSTSSLFYVSSHRGNFSVRSEEHPFSWADTRDELFEREDIPERLLYKSLDYIDEIRPLLKEKQKAEKTLREREWYDLFLSPLEKIKEHYKRL